VEWIVPEDRVSLGIRIGIVGFGLLVAFAGYGAYTRPGDPPELIAAQNAVAQFDYDQIHRIVAAVLRHWFLGAVDESRSV